jgi:hypothetical protein
MFSMTLKKLNTTIPYRGNSRSGQYSSETDDIRSIFADICDILAEMRAVEFSAGGFGQEKWPVDVRYDLLTTIEQVEPVLDSLSQGVRVDLNFPEQGMQRAIHMQPINDIVQLSCSSFGMWRPTEEIDEIDVAKLKSMVAEVAVVFIAASSEHCPELVAHHWFAEWTNRLAIFLA